MPDPRMRVRSRLGIVTLLLCALGCGGGGAGGGSPTPTLEGAWISADFLGHATVLFLHERADGRVVGHLPADPSVLLTGGGRIGTIVALAFAQDDPGLSATGSFSGTLAADGASIDGTYDDGSGPVPAQFTRGSPALWIEHWLLVDFESDEVLSASRLRDAASAFVTGGFVGLDGCGFLACAGDWTSWSITGDDHLIASSSGGLSTTTANLMGTWDLGEKLVMGTYTTSLDATVRDWAAGRVGFAESGPVAQVLRTIADMLDAFEAESPTVVDALANTYLHDGRTKADVQADMTALYAAFDNIEATASVRQVVSANTGEEFPDIAAPPRVEWRLEVTGVPSAGGSRRVVLALDTADSDQEDLRWIAFSGGSVQFSGSGYATPFEIEMPILPADSAKVAFRLWPFGVHGGGHPEGHEGWDVEFDCGAQVRAAADGTVSDVRPNDGFPGQWSVTIRHRPGRSTRYDHLENLQAGITIGASVVSGQVIADAGMTGAHCITHFAMRTGTEAVCPEPFLSAGARLVLDAIWADAAYNEELCEPFFCNPVDVVFPLTRTWERKGGALAPLIEFTRLDPTTSDYRYALRDAGGAALETGTLTFNPLAMPHATIDLVPDSGAATHLGVYDIIGNTMQIDWDDVARPASLAGAGQYKTAPP